MRDLSRPDGEPRDPFVVDPEAARDRRRSGLSLTVLGVVTTVIVGLTAWGLLVPPLPAPSPSPDAPLPSAALGSGPPPSGVTDDSGPERDDDAVLAQLVRRAGWGACPIWRGFGGNAPIGPRPVAAARSSSGSGAGRLEVDDPRGGSRVVWLGADGGAAARALGGTIVVRAGDIVWTALDAGSNPPVAIRLDSGVLDDGTIYWQERVRAMPAPYCLEEATGPPARVVVVDQGADALGRLFVEAGIDACRTWQRMETAGSGTGRDVDQAMDLQGVPVGGAAWASLPVQPGYGEPQVRTWVGRDPGEAGARHGSDLVVLQAGDPTAGDPSGRAWMAVRLDGRPAAIQLRVVETPAGRLAWLPTPNAAGMIGSCSYEADADEDGGEPDGALGEAEGDDRATVEVLRGGPDALAMVVEHSGWTGCRTATTGDVIEAPTLDLVDAAARAGRVRDGWLEVTAAGGSDRIRVWAGDDLVALARASGGAVVATDGTPTAWLADPARATAWRAVVTPEGRTVWFAPGSVVTPDAACIRTAVTPDTIDGIRSFTCWTDRARCLEAVRNAIDAAPDAFTPGTEVAAGIGEWCDPGRRCPWVGPNMPIVVTAAPAGWTSSADVRVFSAGWRRVSMPFREVPAAEAGQAVLGMASRPSLALPVAPPGDPGAVYCPASGVTDEVRGAPWDPRVAWIGLSTVRWPEGFTARFTPTLEVVSPEGAVYREGDRVQASGFAGAAPVFEACRITGTVAP